MADAVQPLHDRRGTLQVDTVEFPLVPPNGFHCTFEVTKRNDGKPNTAEIKVWGLSPSLRGELTAKGANVKKKKVLVQLEVGYKAEISRIFRGDLRLVFHD